MSEQGQKTTSSEQPRPHSPVSVVSRFSFEEPRYSNNRVFPYPGDQLRASSRSSISASSQLSTNHIGLARPLSAAAISSNDRFTSSATPNPARANGLDSNEQIYNVKAPTIAAEICSQGEKQESGGGEERSMWNPFWLWRTTLVGFILVFVLLVIALIILYLFSNLHQGLSTQISRKHYGWTYVITADGLILTSDETRSADSH